MENKGWKQSEVTKSLRTQINDYVDVILTQEIPRIPFWGYEKYLASGSRKEFEASYFNIRKQLSALGLYLMWNPKKEAVDYFNELLWSVSNEFSWCLVAHLDLQKDGFYGDPENTIDLFASETAATLSELVVLHKDIIHPVLQKHIRKQVKDRVLTPFLEKDWWWETSLSNWCAVCAGSVGMAALMVEEGNRKVEILSKVEQALQYYLKCFGEDGETVEGIGYWVYGFGYYIYYTALREELDKDYHLSTETVEKIKNIAQFPQLTQITREAYLPFSDASASTLIPTGLISYLHKEYGAIPPQCEVITPFDFDHCYRFAHISRNLWWTDTDALCKKQLPAIKYFKEAQWLIHRSDRSFFAIKGGTNTEEHNHNDVGGFVLALNGELFLTDLGAGPYTAGYFGAQRYEYSHTRSYWHNVPLLDGKEQVATSKQCQVKEVVIDGQISVIDMEFSGLYEMPELTKVQRRIANDMAMKRFFLKDTIVAEKEILVEETLVSRIKPVLQSKGCIKWASEKGTLKLTYDSKILDSYIEEKEVSDHLNYPMVVYRVGLKQKKKETTTTVSLKFDYN